MNESKKGAVRKKRYTKKRIINKPVSVHSSSESETDFDEEYLEEKEKLKNDIKILKRELNKFWQQIASENESQNSELEEVNKSTFITNNQRTVVIAREANESEVRAAMTRRTHVSSIDVPDDPEDLESPDSIEVGTLTIQDSETKSTQKDLWERPPRYCKETLPEDNSPALLFEILSARIMPPDGEDVVKVKRYVVYELTVRQDTRISMDPQPATIERRYTDFRDMYQSLKRDHPHEMANIDFPNKVLVGNFSASLIAERGQAFEELLMHIARNSVLRSTTIFLNFLQDNELSKACQLLDERNRNDVCISILENSFILLNKIFMDRSKPVLLILCRLVVACTSSPVPHPSAEKWALLALNRYETLCDIDLLPLYIPLLHTCEHLWWQKGRDQRPITDRLSDMSKKGISVNHDPTLMEAIHKLDPRSETI